MLENIMAILDKLEPLILVILPAIFGIWLKTTTKIKEKSDTFKKVQNKKALEKYNMWEHEESRRVILKIKELCRVYKDRSKADEVMYLQLENGTIATSKLCNMFLTCLAEDDRYSEIPKKIRHLQRIPYSQVAEWIDKVTQHDLLIPAVDSATFNIDEVFLKNVKSHMSRTVYDKDGYLIGMVIFNYAKEHYNTSSEEPDPDYEQTQLNLLRQFQASVETVFVTYHVARIDMKRELGINDDEDGGESND